MMASLRPVILLALALFLNVVDGFRHGGLQRRPRAQLQGARAQQMVIGGEDPMLEVLLDAARKEDVDVLDEKFDEIPHATMILIQNMAAGDVPEARWLVKAMDGVMQERLADGATKLRELLAAGEINRMDGELVKLVRNGGADTAFNIVLTSNIEHARSTGDETMLKLYVHLHTRMQEELEKKASPAVGLLHRLLRTDDAGLRGRILVDFMVPKRTVSMPGGKEIKLDTPSPPKVTPIQFGEAIADAVSALGSVQLGELGSQAGESPISESVEECREVAKIAREVIADHYTEEELVEFQDLLMPVFSVHMDELQASKKTNAS